jgi:Lanthionine synthetase C-like protein/HopA1 effector protein family
VKSFLAQFEQIVESVEIRSVVRYSWCGQTRDLLSHLAKLKLSVEELRQHLMFSLRMELYSNYYTRGYVEPLGEEVRYRAGSHGRTAFVQVLSAANAGRGCWTTGWSVRRRRDDEVVVERQRLELRVQMDECSLSPEEPAEPGTGVRVLMPKESLSMSPGHYTAFGDMEMDEAAQRELVRLYWNVSPDGAVRLMRAATAWLNEAGVPFRLKVLNDPELFTRCDAGVLYLAKRDFPAAGDIIRRVHASIRGTLAPAVPMFTKWLADGLSLAEDPGNSDSFGLHRCTLVADGLILSYEQGKRRPAERLAVVRDRFEREGHDFGRPYLNPGSLDPYTLELSPVTRGLRARPEPTPSGTAGYAGIAGAIGGKLVTTAMWDGERCNWLGPETRLDGSGRLVSGGTVSPLGVDLYSGTSGIGLFLAELGAASGDEGATRTALGAMRHALSRIDDLPPASQLGFFTGRTGVVLAALRVGMVLGADDMLERAVQLLRRANVAPEERLEFDLMGGKAGAAVALVIASTLLGDEAYLRWAVDLGDQLLEAAVTSERGASWPASHLPGSPHLTGFSHGAAGIGYALFELFHASGAGRFRETGRAAFDYERSWFDARQQNWRDLRAHRGGVASRAKRIPCATAWCHGAPGIGVSRLRAAELFRDRTCEDEARAALRTTAAAVSMGLARGNESYSLCHGLAGNAQVLAYGAEVLGDATGDLGKLVREVADVGVARHGAEDRWPCGSDGAKTPGYMLGVAGIGAFYLQLHIPAVPGWLIPRRDTFEKARSDSR